jgi:hypothetical protein
MRGHKLIQEHSPYGKKSKRSGMAMGVFRSTDKLNERQTPRKSTMKRRLDDNQ